jgi:hypothetical protein
MIATFKARAPSIAKGAQEERDATGRMPLTLFLPRTAARWNQVMLQEAIWDAASPVPEPVTSDHQRTFIRKPMNAKYCHPVCRAPSPISPKENEQPGTKKHFVPASPTPLGAVGLAEPPPSKAATARALYISAPFESMMGAMFVIRHQAATVSGIYLCCCFVRLSKGPFSSDMSGRQSNKED